MGENMNNQNESAGAVTAEETTGTHGNMEDMESQNRTPQEKKYTDADVDRIVKKKIANERKRMQKLFEEGQQESDLDRREKELTKRELRADARDAIQENGLPACVADLLNYNSKEEYESSLNTAMNVVAEIRKAVDLEKATGRVPRSYSSDQRADPKEAVRDAFRL